MVDVSASASASRLIFGKVDGSSPFGDRHFFISSLCFEEPRTEINN